MRTLENRNRDRRNETPRLESTESQVHLHQPLAKRRTSWLVDGPQSISYFSRGFREFVACSSLIRRSSVLFFIGLEQAVTFCFILPQQPEWLRLCQRDRR